MSDQIVYRSRIVDEFEGFDEDNLFELENGTYWVQSRYKYKYKYAYRPKVEILKRGSSTILRLPDLDMEVDVYETNIVESRIRGEFKGWSGTTEFELENGQIWKQTRYAYQYMYAYYPKVVIANIGGRYIMSVNGNSIEVRRIK
jgi:hypothetical protein